MRAPVTLVLLALASSLLAAEIPISQADLIPVDQMMYRAGAPIAAAGDGFAVVWSEAIGSSYFAVKLRTYDDDGTPRQALPIILGDGHTPHVFWNGSEYVVVYAPNYSKFGAGSLLPAVVSRRVRPDGVPVPGVETLVTDRLVATVLALAWDGVNALAAVRSGVTNHLLLLDRDGKLITDTPIDYAPGAIAARAGGGFFVVRSEQGSAVAAGGDRFAVINGIASKTGGVTAAILDSAGAELEHFTLSAEGGYQATGIVWDGRAWIAAYGESGTLCTSRFTSASDVVKTCRAASASTPSLALGPGGLFTAWNAGGQVMTDSGLASSTWSSVSGSDAAVEDDGIVAAWIETVPNGAQIRVGGLAGDGTRRPEYGIPAAIAPYDHLRLARGARDTFLVWSQNRDLYGVVLGPNATPPETYFQFRSGSSPAIAARGDEWVIAYSSPTGIESIHMNRSFDVTTFEEFGGPAGQAAPAVAATSTGYLVAWWEAENGIARVVVEPLDAGGHRTVGGNRIVENGPIAFPAVGCGRDTCLVTWYGAQDEMWCTLVRHDGTKVSADRVFPAHVMTVHPVIEALADGSFLVYRGGAVTPISATGEPGATQVWTAQPIALANVVTWRGNRTLVYTRAVDGAPQLFAFELAGRPRSVRH